MSKDTRELAEQAKHFFQGMRSVRNGEDLPLLASWPDWSAVARRELERRVAAVMERFDDRTVAAVAAGTLDFKTIIRDVINNP